MPIVKRDVEGVDGAFILDNVLTADECKQFITLTEEMGYDIAPITVGEGVGQVMTDVRDNKRVMWQSKPEITDAIWERVKDFLPATISYPSGTWDLKGLNERLRFYRCNYQIISKSNQFQIPNNNNSVLTLTALSTEAKMKKAILHSSST
jgi:hypothetical protein